MKKIVLFLLLSISISAQFAFKQDVADSLNNYLKTVLVKSLVADSLNRIDDSLSIHDALINALTDSNTTQRTDILANLALINALEDSGTVWRGLINNVFDSLDVHTSLINNKVNLADSGKVYLSPDSTFTQNLRAGNKLALYPQNEYATDPVTYIVIVFDHGSDSTYTVFFPMFQSKGIPGCLSLWQKTYVDSFMTVAEILEVQTAGWEIQSHIDAGSSGGSPITYAHSLAQADSALGEFKTYHQGLGFNVKTANYLGGGTTAAYTSAIKKYYNSAGTIDGGVHKQPINQFALGRHSLDAGKYNEWIALVDSAINNNALLIFYGHAANTGTWFPYDWYNTKYDDDGNIDPAGDYIYQKIGRLIDYIQAKPEYGTTVDIVTMSEALENFGNSFDSGNKRNFTKVDGFGRTNVLAERFHVGNDGSVEFKGREQITELLPNNQTLDDLGVEYTTSQPPSRYPNYKKSHTILASGGNYYSHTFPAGSNSILITDRLAKIQYNYQVGGTLGYKRKELNDSTWSEWTLIVWDDEFRRADDFATGQGDSSITNYTDRTYTVRETLASGIPSLSRYSQMFSGNGNLETSKLTDTYGWRQIFTPRQNTYGIQAKRYVDPADSGWYSWKEDLAGEFTETLNIDFPSIAANSTAEMTVWVYPKHTRYTTSGNFSAQPDSILRFTGLVVGDKYFLDIHPNTGYALCGSDSLYSDTLFTATDDTVRLYASGSYDVVSGSLLYSLQHQTAGGAETTDLVVATPANGIESGLVWSAYISEQYKVKVRLANVTGGAINPVNRSWRIKCIK